MFFKRTFAFFLICTLCLFPGLYAGAAGENNLISNPSFESLREDNLFPNGWLRSSGGITGSAQYAHSGSRSLKLTHDGTSTYLYARTTVYGITGGAEYTFGTWLLTMNANLSFRYRYSCFNAAGEYLYDAAGNAEYDDYPGEWEHFTEKFRPPRGTTYMTIQLRISQPGTVYCDDVSMHLTDGPEKLYDFQSDGTFIYTERTRDGEVSVTADTDYYPELVGKEVQFSVFDPEKPDIILKEDSIRIPANGKIRFTYPMRLLSEKLKPYTLKITLQPPDADRIVKTHTVYKVDRPKHVDDRGFFRDENNKIFTPSIMYGVQLDSFKTIKTVGANAVQGYPSKEWLDALQKENMKCFAVLYSGATSAGNSSRISTTVKYVKSVMHHPAVFGWLIYDEPNPTNGNTLEELERAYLRIREVDPDHPIVITANDHYDVLHQYSDAIIQDSYPYNNARFTTYPYERNVKAIAESDGRPVYHLIQTFDHLNSFPKPQEVRNMQYASLWAGCKGFGYYKYKFSENSFLYNTNLWDAMLAFAENEQELAFDIFIHNKYQKLKEEVLNAYQYGIWKDDDGYYVIVRSKTYDSPVTAEMQIPESGVWQAEPIGGTPNAFSSGGGKIRVTVNNGDVVLLKIQKSLVLGENGRQVTALSGGMTVNVKSGFEIKSAYTPKILISLYHESDGREECVGFYAPALMEEDGENGVCIYTLNQQVKIPEGKGKYNIKIFYWDRNMHCLQKAMTAI